MSTKKTLFFTFLIALLSYQCAADTIRLMQYNLLYYTDYADYTDCNAETNNLNTKDYYLRDIINYVQPDVFCVNEIGKEEAYAERILNNVLNYSGERHFATIPTVTSWSTIANRIFYDTEKFHYYNAFYVWTPITYINGFKLYYNSQELAHGDTTFLTFIVLHLKAGSYSGNQTSRHEAMVSLMNRLEMMGADNYILSGDFNCYGHLDSGIANALYWDNAAFRFYDPLNQLGRWGSNPSFSYIHTQSTHSGFNDACFSGGGMDDRFDFILTSPYVHYGSHGVKAINSSYQTVGQDGLRYRKSLIDPPNNSVPYNVLLSLYGNSDHLPVFMDFELNAKLDYSSINQNTVNFNVQITNPIQHRLHINIESSVAQKITCKLFSIEGKLLREFTHSLTIGENKIDEPFSYSSGIYILQIVDEQQHQIARKLFK